MTRCSPPDCACDCHVPAKPRPENLASPAVVAYRKREALAALELARQKRTTVEEQP